MKVEVLCLSVPIAGKRGRGSAGMPITQSCNLTPRPAAPVSPKQAPLLGRGTGTTGHSEDSSPRPRTTANDDCRRAT